MSEKKTRLYVVSLSTWFGFAERARHWYASVKWRDDAGEVREHRIVDERGEHKGFDTESLALGGAIEWWREQRFPESLLVTGIFSACGPRKALTGEAQLVDRALALYERAEAIGWWDKDRKAMDAIMDEWDSIFNA